MIVVLLLLLPVTGRAGGVPCEDSDHPLVRNAIDMVNRAVALIAADGRDAIDVMQQGGDQWVDKDGYIFVHAMDGTLVCNPAYPELVGKNMLAFRDVAGKPMAKFALDEAAEPGDGGWIHYLWPRPGTDEPGWKSAFIRQVRGADGKVYAVGCGYYNLPMQDCFAVHHVDEAVALIEKEGEKVFPYLGSRIGPFVWGTSYVFVTEVNGIARVHPGQPQMIGTNIGKAKDVNGKAFAQEIASVPYGNPGRWIEYLWPKPGELRPSTKRTYARKARFNGKEYVVGCGLYIE